MKNTRRFLLVLAAVAMGSTVASASSIYTDTFFFGPTSVSGSTVVNAVLQKFDDNLLGPGGSLTNIAFILSVTDVASASVTNSVLSCTVSGCTPGGDLNVITFGGSVPVAVAGPSGMNTSTTPQAVQDYSPGTQVVHNIFTSCVGFSCTVNNANILTANSLTDTRGSSTNVTNSVAAFAPYHSIGGGTFNPGDITITLGPASVVGVGDANLNYSANSTVNGSLQVVYTYDSSVPEPATVTLMGSALLGLGMVMRRKFVKR